MCSLSVSVALTLKVSSDAVGLGVLGRLFTQPVLLNKYQKSNILA